MVMSGYDEDSGSNVASYVYSTLKSNPSAVIELLDYETLLKKIAMAYVYGDKLPEHILSLLPFIYQYAVISISGVEEVETTPFGMLMDQVAVSITGEELSGPLSERAEMLAALVGDDTREHYTVLYNKIITCMIIKLPEILKIVTPKHGYTHPDLSATNLRSVDFMIGVFAEIMKYYKEIKDVMEC